MTKRKFGKERLIKLFKILYVLVFLITSLLAMKAWIDVSNYKDAAGNKTLSILSGDYVSSQRARKHREAKRDANFWTTIAIGLSASYFGGSALINYLFPKDE